MLDPHREIQALIDSFVDRLGEIAKRIALEQLKQAFGTAKLPPVRRSSSPPPPVPSPASSASSARRSRARRGQHEIEVLRDKLLTVISDNPGCRAEDINSALGTKTPQIAPPLRRLIAEQRVRTEGARRGTRYFTVAPVEVQSGRRPVEPVPIPEEPPAAAIRAI
jgi:hypothetical protein